MRTVGLVSRIGYRAFSMSKPPSSKLIFAPGEGTSQQAAQFEKGTLELSQLSQDPFSQFHEWFSLAQEQKVLNPETCTLSTASLPSGRVSARMVYLKELEQESSKDGKKGGFVIYTNLGTSRKAADLKTNPYASLTFWWKDLERQVRVEGVTERLSSEESQVYYNTRARGSRLGAWASQQSSVLDGREELDQQVKDVEKRFEGQGEIPVPEFWGGLRVVPDVIEFWQGRDSRLHDRFQYTKEEGGDGWKIQRLSP